MLYGFDFISPETPLHFPLFKEKNVEVFLKRDDLIHPYISGNKWRKLKHVLTQAQAHSKTKLVTFGGAWSNHLLATAAAGAQFHFETVGFIRGDRVSNPVLSLCALYGMKLHFVSRESYRDKKRLFDDHFANTNSFFIDEGGYSAEAALGCEDIVGELENSYDHIILASGTGATTAGLLNGVTKYGSHAMVHSVPVLKGGGFIQDKVAALATSTTRLHLHTGYHFGGYAKIKPELVDFIRQFVASTGIMIEPTYTGKMLYALFDLIENDFFKKDTRILAVHTGGLTGFLGMHHLFDK